MCARHGLNLLSFITHASVILWEIVSFSIFPLSKAVIGISRLIYKQIDNHNQKTQCYSGVKILWPVQNSKITISAIQTLNWRNKAISISASAFSTLKTNIPHHKVISVIAELINFSFNVCDKQFTGIHVVLFGLIVDKNIRSMWFWSIGTVWGKKIEKQNWWKLQVFTVKYKQQKRVVFIKLSQMVLIHIILKCCFPTETVPIPPIHKITKTYKTRNCQLFINSSLF